MRYTIPMRAADLLVPRPEGLYCPPGDFYIDPMRPVARALVTHAHSDHATRGHGAVLATRETLDIMAIRLGEGFAAGDRRPRPSASAIALGDVDGHLPSRPAMCSARRRSPWRHGGFRIVASGDYKRTPGPDLRRLRAGALRHLHHRGDLRPAGLPPSRRRVDEIRRLLALAGAVPRAHPPGRRLRARQGAAGDPPAARRRL